MMCAGYDIPTRWQPGHVFSLVAQPESGGILAGCCSDGSLRYWFCYPESKAICRVRPLHLSLLHNWHCDIGFVTSRAVTS